MFSGPITFDRLARWLLCVAAIAAAFAVLHYLSAVLLPFFVAWLLAYLLYPVVAFIERRLRVRVRAVSVLLAMVLAVAVLVGIGWLIIPPMIEQSARACELAVRYLHHVTHISDFPDAIQQWVALNSGEIEHLLRSQNFSAAVREALPRVLGFAAATWSVALSVIASCITLLYMFFILMDYEYLTERWIIAVPPQARPFWAELMRDVERALNNYIRGQGLIALIMGVLFCIGFTIIGFPMAIGLGILIGIMDLVPYLHTFALIPTALLAAMKAADTGQNYWVVLGSAVAVFCIVQVIIDAIVTPRVMGRRMGLNPAVLLLALSVWGALLGFLGLIIALPATTIIFAYWKRYVSKVN